MVIIHEEPVLLRFTNYGQKLPIVCVVICWIITLLVPYLIVLFTGQFWMKEATFIQQPAVTFRNKAFLQVHGESDDRFWSSSASFNDLLDKSKFVFPTLQVVPLHGTKAYSVNNYKIGSDYKPERFTITLLVPSPGFAIQAVTLMLFFGYKIERYGIEMESLVFIQNQYSSMANMTVFGDLRIRQNVPLNQYMSATTFNTSFEFTNIKSLNQFCTTCLLHDSYAREVSTSFVPIYPSHIVSAPNPTDLSVTVHVNIPFEKFSYVPGFLEVIKFAFVQYLCVFLITYWICFKVLRILVIKGMLNTRVTYVGKYD